MDEVIQVIDCESEDTYKSSIRGQANTSFGEKTENLCDNISRRRHDERKEIKEAETVADAYVNEHNEGKKATSIL